MSQVKRGLIVSLSMTCLLKVLRSYTSFRSVKELSRSSSFRSVNNNMGLQVDQLSFDSVVSTFMYVVFPSLEFTLGRIFLNKIVK